MVIYVVKCVEFYRMVMENYICFYGLKVFDLFKWEGYEVDDYYLMICVEMDVFKVKYDV